VDQIQGSSNTTIDLTGDYPPLHLESLLDGVPLKVFSFHQDVRPGYRGTYTRPVSPRSKKTLSRQPSARRLPDTDYDYDSEAEWEPPDDGDDDVDAVDEESGSEEEEDDMEDFLDDEDDVGRRRPIVGNMDPVCSGLCWEGEAKKTFTSCGPFNMKEFEMEIINGQFAPNRLVLNISSTMLTLSDRRALPSYRSSFDQVLGSEQANPAALDSITAVAAFCQPHATAPTPSACFKSNQHLAQSESINNANSAPVDNKHGERSDAFEIVIGSTNLSGCAETVAAYIE
jgi:hypothetical protein